MMRLKLAAQKYVAIFLVLREKLKSFRELNCVVEHAVKYSECVKSYIKADKTTVLRDIVVICYYIGVGLAFVCLHADLKYKK